MGSSKENALGADYNGELTPLAVRRLNKEKDQLGRETKDLTEQGMYYSFDESRNHKAVALIVGPEDTPYAGGFYLFEFTFPNTYPLKPPHVKFMTGDGRVRFNPNLYVNGKNEPGYENEAGKDSDLYATMVRYENVNVAVMQLARCAENMKPFRGTMARIFLRRLAEHLKVLDDFDVKDGKQDKCPLYGFATRYAPAEVRKKLETLKEKLLQDSELKDELAKDAAPADASSSTPASGADEAPLRQTEAAVADDAPAAKRQRVDA